jgi:glycosyltransferase involved in cell wall biosynthesis
VSIVCSSAQRNDVTVFVHLGHGFGKRSWSERYQRGLIPGLNDRFAYGYFRAAGNGWSVEQSEDATEGALTQLCRIALRKVLGCDLIHAWRNRHGLFACDIVWTHTEIENLAVLLLFAFYPWRRRPKLIANCVWLFDRWSGLSRPRRAIYRRLLKRADVVSTFSPENIRVARRLFPTVRCEFIRWGPAVQELKAPLRRNLHSPLRIASLGNDIHRDWKTLLEAFGNRMGYEIGIASRRVRPRLLAGLNNVRIVSAVTAKDVKALYEWADLVVVSVKPNLHVSGITVVLEAVILGIPVVCTDSGGLRAYFSSSEVKYVPTYAPLALRIAVEELAQDDERRWDMANRAQQRLLSASLTAQGFAERNRLLSEQLFVQRPNKELTGDAARSIA